MKSFLFFSIVGIFLFSCSEETGDKEHSEKETKEVVEEMTPERYVEFSLRIPKNEKVSIEKHYAHCNIDDSLDLVITVNLLERAMNKAIETNSTAKSAEIGYMGQYNYIIYQDGMTKEYSKPLIIPSSAMSPVSITFEHVISEFYKDILVDFKVMNGGFREYFTVVDKLPTLVLQLPIYTELGTSQAEGFTLTYEPGSYSLAKDIVVYKGSMENPSFTQPDEVYGYVPEISPTNTEERRWFFNPGKFKYYTKTNDSE